MILSFNEWLINENAIRPTKDLSLLNKFRVYKGDTYRTTLFPMFMKYRGQFGNMNIEDWFKKMQEVDNGFYTMVQCDHVGQPDVRELWRDITMQLSAKANLATPMVSGV